VERFKSEDKISNIDIDNSIKMNKKKRLCSVCKTGHIDYSEEVDIILRMAKDLRKKK
jgi:hypothetical protein